MTTEPHAQTDAGAASGADARLELRNIEKHFGGVRALRGANMKVSSGGVVHGLMGENGSGKSTLLGVLSGQIQADEGHILVNSELVNFASPTAALRGGIAMVSQETALADELTIAENIFLGRRMVRGLTGINWKATGRKAAEVLNRLELEYDPSWLVARLRPDQKQMVEIARALSMNTRVLILDEPTSSLTDDQVQALFRAVRQIKQTGVATIFVSHRLDEVFDLVDELTVLRDGSTVAQGHVGEFTTRSLVDVMVGKEGAWHEYARPSSDSSARTDRVPALQVSGMTIPGCVDGVDITVEPGEIVGIAGLVGAGRSELLEGIFGLRAMSEGTIEINGKPIQARSPRAAIREGLGFLPPDRKQQGLVLQRTIDENLTMVATLGRSRWRAPGGAEVERKAEEVSKTMRLRAASRQALVSTLSGGNQQKVAVGKWLMADPQVLMLDEPTRGVDVAAKSEIHELLRNVASTGVGLLVVSSENEELIQLSDRILIMFSGRIVASVPATEADVPTIARYAGGHI